MKPPPQSANITQLAFALFVIPIDTINHQPKRLLKEAIFSVHLQYYCSIYSVIKIEFDIWFILYNYYKNRDSQILAISKRFSVFQIVNPFSYNRL